MLAAKRQLKLRLQDKDIAIEVRLFCPEFEESDWSCRYEIQWPEGLRSSAAMGIDSMQALHLALQKIGTELYMSDHHASGRLIWEVPNDGYGFPVPKNGRDILIGSDKLFEG